jgi:hypothetical protein
LAAVGYSSSIVFYNSFLPNIASPDKYAAVSARGFSLGYAGSVLLLLLILTPVFLPNIAIFQGITFEKICRIGFVLTGIWWFSFGFISVSGLPKSEKEIFIDLISRMETSWNESAQLYEKFKINLLEYEERYFSLLEDMVYYLYEDWEAEIMLWYVYGRIDEEGNLYSLVLNTDNEKKEIIINNPTQLWDFIVMLKKDKNKNK